MSTDLILKAYSNLGINSQSGLYDYVISHDKATINSVDYDFNKSNESMEFMALFFDALGFKVKRFYLENDDKRHWFLAFNNGFTWFYYEVTIKEIIGKYAFKNFNNLIMFALSKIIKSLEGVDGGNINLLEGYTLKEIGSLNEFNIEDNISFSKKGKEILAWSNLNNDEDYNRIIKKAEKEEIRNRRDYSNLVSFVVGFIITLSIGVFLVWLLAMYYYGKF